jgi:hypothetical protein
MELLARLVFFLSLDIGFVQEWIEPVAIRFVGKTGQRFRRPFSNRASVSLAVASR